MAVRIVTDSVSDLPAQAVQELGISVVPLNVTFGTEVYRDGIDMPAEQFYERLVDCKTLPVTSAPSPTAFTEIYDKLAEETDEIVVITLSAKLSATNEVASQSIDLMKNRCRIEVVDSEWAVMAQGFIVITAARAAQAGASLDEVLDIVQRNRSRVNMRAAFDTLEYLKKGGRIGRASALLGSILKINPLITIKDGEVEPAGRTRSRVQAIDNLVNFIMGYSNIEEIAVEDAACPDEAGNLVERLSSRLPRERIYRSKTTPVIGTHTGPGLLVVTVLGDK